MNNQRLTIEGAVTYSRLFDALKAMYEVDDDDSVWEIFSQADDQIEEVVNALKLLSAPPAPFVVPLRKYTVAEVMHLSQFSRDYAEGWCSANDNAINEIKKAGGSVADA